MVQGFVPKVAFICRTCGAAIGDGAYCGPWGHAPQDVCFSCWLEAFEAPPTQWPRQVLMVWLLSNGYGRGEAARLCGVSRRTVSNWLIRLRTDAAEFFETLSHLDDFCAIRRLKEGR